MNPFTGAGEPKCGKVREKKNPKAGRTSWSGRGGKKVERTLVGAGEKEEEGIVARKEDSGEGVLGSK